MAGFRRAADSRKNGLQQDRSARAKRCFRSVGSAMRVRLGDVPCLQVSSRCMWEEEIHSSKTEARIDAVRDTTVPAKQLGPSAVDVALRCLVSTLPRHREPDLTGVEGAHGLGKTKA